VQRPPRGLLWCRFSNSGRFGLLVRTHGEVIAELHADGGWFPVDARWRKAQRACCDERGFVETGLRSTGDRRLRNVPLFVDSEHENDGSVDLLSDLFWIFRHRIAHEPRGPEKL